MTEEEFRYIFDESSEYSEISGSRLRDENRCNAISGLIIIQAYCQDKGIEGAGHEITYSVDVEELVNSGISRSDAIELLKLNWMIDSDTDCMACYV